MILRYLLLVFLELGPVLAFQDIDIQCPKGQRIIKITREKTTGKARTKKLAPLNAECGEFVPPLENPRATSCNPGKTFVCGGKEEACEKGEWLAGFYGIEMDPNTGALLLRPTCCNHKDIEIIKCKTKKLNRPWRRFKRKLKKLQIFGSFKCEKHVENKNNVKRLADFKWKADVCKYKVKTSKPNKKKKKMKKMSSPRFESTTEKRKKNDRSKKEEYEEILPSVTDEEVNDSREEEEAKIPPPVVPKKKGPWGEATTLRRTTIYAPRSQLEIPITGTRKVESLTDCENFCDWTNENEEAFPPRCSSITFNSDNGNCTLIAMKPINLCKDWRKYDRTITLKYFPSIHPDNEYVCH